MKLEDLNYEIKKVFGNSYEAKSINRLMGGAQKGTFKVECSSDFIFILYIWDRYYDNFYKPKKKLSEMTSNSAALFLKNSKMLKEHNKQLNHNLDYLLKIMRQ